MELVLEKHIHSEDEMTEFAQNFASSLSDGAVVILNGNLGAGKTFIVKAIAKLWKIENVTSPTFALVNDYTGTKRVIHFDFYRVGEEQELYDIGFDEYLSDENAIKFIEWGELFPFILPNKRVELKIIIGDGDFRTITVFKYE
ncbi:MAG: tRNA (adenosine(37)-N6)-threonylcarbamoyltransferase complex ATPase subunit type 1 TsaE [Ignavibacteria bacterium]|jgi:tRNA threonylcarbamoyladenosine biosynthesis protein TsaE|nr:tRNA (adenosine(37)-N6)-threonylcarbamoyltransferase complex ATPase subunit type 1 TsaE [Ignavibacteria bacterium]